MPSGPTVGDPPGPDGAASLDELIARLQAFRAWRGMPYRELHRRLVRRRRSDGIAEEPAYATVFDALPEDIGDFTGREPELALVLERVRSRQSGLLAIEGMAGVGKTSLAVHAARWCSWTTSRWRSSAGSRRWTFCDAGWGPR